MILLFVCNQNGARCVRAQVSLFAIIALLQRARYAYTIIPHQNGDLLMTNHSSIAPEIVAHAAYFSAEPIVSIVRITDGSINDTYEVKTDSGFVFIL
jgi:hypothetical protein